MRLRDALGGVRERFDYVLLDCPPSLGPLTVNALVAADRVIVPVQTEYFALEGLAGLLDTLALIQRELNPRLTIAGMLLTMHDGRTRLARDVEREVREHFPSLVFDTVIPRNVRVGEAPSYGRPVTHHDPHCAGLGRVLRARQRGRASGSAVVSGKQRGMGRGLAAILAVSGGHGPAIEDLRMIPVELVVPNPKQPRRSFDEAGARGARGSLRERGVLQPVLVRPVAGGTYELVAGERRWRAAQIAGLETIPALVRDRDDAEALEAALIENMAREDLNPVEEARACAALVEELGLTREIVGLRVGRSRVAVSNLLRLLDLPDEALELLERGDLSEGHGRALLLATDHADRRRLARSAAAEGWSVRVLEAKAREANEPDAVSPPRARGRQAELHPDQEAAATQIADALGGALGIEVTVKPRGTGYRVELRLRRSRRGTRARPPPAPPARRRVSAR